MNSLQTKKIYINIILSFIFSCTLSINDLKSQPILTIGEIYDYDIGDVFHYHIAFGGGGIGTTQYTNIEVLDKFYSNNNDTVYYVLDKASKEQNYPLTYWEYSFVVDTVYYSKLDSVICDSALVNIDSSLYHGRVINTCFYSSYGDSWMYKWAVGCGQVGHTFSSTTHSHVWDEELVYYKKGSEIWGVPVYVNIKEQSLDIPEISVYPNPAKDFINIATKSENEYVEIYSIVGLLVRRIILIDESTKINISDLKRGVYILIISLDEDRFIKKLIKE